ncbi:C-type lectin 37Da-like [Cloeon dipterum]|uniref:C-type lectin 37Da-like n=1 Tax=Cloeon dipterum TaxID=197152 RepID=UPI00321FEFFF
MHSGIVVAALLGMVLCCTAAPSDPTVVPTTAFPTTPTVAPLKTSTGQSTVAATATAATIKAARNANGVGGYFWHEWRYYEVSSVPAPWFLANYECKRKGMALVSLETREEDDYIRQHLFSNFPGEHFWTSGNDVYQEGSYYWDSTGNAVGPYRNWAPNQPVAGTTLNCIAYDRNLDIRWVTSNCNNPLRYICEQYY